MAPNLVLHLFPQKQLKSIGEAIDSVTDISGFPPKPTESVKEALNSVTERLFSSPVKLMKQLVFTEFGLSPVTETPSLHLPPCTSSFPPVKAESPRSVPRPNIKANNGAPKVEKRCRCKRSRCLKLYCECFANGAYCDGCNCTGCRNNIENEAMRQAAAKSILERKPYAFSPKIASTPCSAQDSEENIKDVPTVGKHNRGCGCKKTRCLQKYCECFHAEVFCSENCKCVDCKNLEGSVEMMALSRRECNNTEICENFAAGKRKIVVFDVDNSDTNICKRFEGSEEKMAFPGMEKNMRKIQIQQANAAIYSALGMSGHSLSQESGKRKFQEFLDSNGKDPHIEILADDQKVSTLLQLDSNIKRLAEDQKAFNLLRPALKIQRLSDDQKVSNILHPDSNIQRLADDQKANALRVSGPSIASSADPIDHTSSSATLSSSKFCSRSLLADIIRSQDIEDLCSFLVLVSESVKIHPDRNGTSDIQNMRETQNTNIQVMENFREKPDVQQEVPDDNFSGNQADGVKTDNFVPGGINVKERRHSYLRKIALKSNEKDKTFTGPTKRKILNHGGNTDVFIKRERLVLACFRDFLRKIITLGNVKASHQLKSMVDQQQHVNNPL